MKYNNNNNNDKTPVCGHIRTLFGTFHHFNEKQAINILCDAMKNNDAFVMCELIIHRGNIFDFVKWPVLLMLIIPLNWITLIYAYFEQNDINIFIKMFKSIRLIITTPVWYCLFVHDAIISCSRIYLESELIQLTELATIELMKQKNKNKNKNNILEYEWKVIRTQSTMKFPFNYLTPMTIFCGIPKIDIN